MIGNFIRNLHTETVFFFLLLCGIGGTYGALRIYEHDEYLIGGLLLGSSCLVYGLIYATFAVSVRQVRDLMWRQAEKDFAAGIKDDDDPVIDWKD